MKRFAVVSFMAVAAFAAPQASVFAQTPEWVPLQDGKYGLDAYFQKKTIYVNFA